LYSKPGNHRTTERSNHRTLLRIRMFTLSPDDRAFLHQARVARLATASATGEPHVVPVCFVFDGTHFYSAIDGKPKRVAAGRLRRLQNLRENPRATLLVDSYEEEWARLRYVLVMGRGEILETGTDRERAFHLLREKYPQYHVMRDFGQGAVIRLMPERVVSWRGAPTAPIAP
jgi:PPOX class probable F420-dependent enzyme